MEATGVIMFYEKCRLCLANPGEKHIFETQGLQDDIIACTGVKILPSDNLPEKICTKCLEVVINAKELREMVEKNDYHLRTLFLNENDDDSRETICLEICINEEACNEENSQRDISAESNEGIRTNNIEDQSSIKRDKSPVLKVRKDLFKTKDKVKVKSKEDYNKYKDKIKLDPDFVVEYECEICNKKYDTYKKLYLHKRQHNKTNFCPIDVCGKSFSTKGDLEKHLRTHTGVRPYACEICDKTFTQQGTLKHHKETVHYSFIVP